MKREKCPCGKGYLSKEHIDELNRLYRKDVVIQGLLLFTSMISHFKRKKINKVSVKDMEKYIQKFTEVQNQKIGGKKNEYKKSN